MTVALRAGVPLCVRLSWQRTGRCDARCSDSDTHSPIDVPSLVSSLSPPILPSLYGNSLSHPALPCKSSPPLAKHASSPHTTLPVIVPTLVAWSVTLSLPYIDHIIVEMSNVFLPTIRSVPVVPSPSAVRRFLCSAAHSCHPSSSVLSRPRFVPARRLAAIIVKASCIISTSAVATTSICTIVSICLVITGIVFRTPHPHCTTSAPSFWHTPSARKLPPARG
ncbi:hypothetical protein NUW54_g7674 [Trametes sanguinea]|uniref:Uncharacterized protein n=1 Tax=Trametes sanguinea TaxID=158606 RepID=A0ACC1PJQ4_9APHY|nr:hypothetical protein NUW54_g7674 [Trametes sanguinea]